MSDVRTLGGVPDSAIDDLESLLGHSIPARYRTFLQQHGAGVVRGMEIYGLGTDFQGPPNLGWLLTNLGRLGLKRPAAVLPIAEVGDGSYFSVTLEDIEDYGTGVLVIWNPRRDGVVELQATKKTLASILP